MLHRIRCLPLLITLTACPALAWAESQDFHLVGQSVEVDLANQQAAFSIIFNQPLSFAAVDGGQIKTFQYEIDADRGDVTTPIAFTDIDTVIRGGEIFEGNGIPVRDATGDGGPNAGGWGPVRVLLPFNTNDNTFTFTASLNDIGDQDGLFRYRLFTTDMGAITSDVEASTAAIPLPAGVCTGVIVLAVMGIVARMRQRAHRTG